MVEVEEIDSYSDESLEENDNNFPTLQNTLNLPTSQSATKSYSTQDSYKSDDDVPLSSIANTMKHIIILKNASIKGRNGHRWSTIEPQLRKRTSARNIIHFVPGSKGLAADIY